MKSVETSRLLICVLVLVGVGFASHAMAGVCSDYLAYWTCCDTDEDCEGSEATCEENPGFCSQTYSPCQEAEDCSEGEACERFRGMCSATLDVCSSSDDCGPSQYCLPLGNCTGGPPEAEGSPCVWIDKAVYGICSNLTGICLDNYDCAGGLCLDNYEESIGLCGDFVFDFAPRLCQSDDNCDSEPCMPIGICEGESTLCLDYDYKMCQISSLQDPYDWMFPCRTNEDCPNKFCQYSFFEYLIPCRTDQDCFGGSPCLEEIPKYCSVTTLPCTNDSDCYPGEHCVEIRECSLTDELCLNDAHCPEGELCARTLQSSCERVYSCMGPNGECEPFPPCFSDQDCPENYTCAGDFPMCCNSTCDPISLEELSESGEIPIYFDSCGEGGVCESCFECTEDSNCDDGLFCNGEETCDVALGCQPGENPCTAGEYCDEETDSCKEGAFFFVPNPKGGGAIIYLD